MSEVVDLPENSDQLPERLPASTLARLLNISSRRLSQLAADGIIPSGKKGKYEVEATITGYCEFLQSSNAKNAMSDEREELARRKEQLQVDRLEREEREARSELAEIEEIADTLRDVLGDVRDSVLGFSDRVDVEMGGEAPPEVLDIIESVSREKLQDLELKLKAYGDG